MREAIITLHVTIHNDDRPLADIKSAAINLVDGIDNGMALDVERAKIEAI